MNRRLELDAARGAMLVWMTLVHLPTLLTPWLNQPLGYISASEGFIFLSALFTGRIYFRLLERDGPRAMTWKLFLRALRLYRYHLLLLFGVFVVVARFAISGHNQGLYNVLDFYFAAGPARAIVDALLLIYRPPLLDIIPLYLIFLILSPLVLIAAAKIGWKFILGGSFAVWLLAQFGLRQALYGLAAHYLGLRIPLNEMGAFNLWAWQFMWILGMWCGVRWARNNLPVEKWAERAWIPAAFVAASLLVLRYSELRGLHLAPFAVVLDKWHLGAVRLVDFAAIACLAVRFQSVIKPLAVRPLILLGQSSLQVFCAHFVFCFIGLGLMGAADRIFGWPQFALIAGTFASLLIVAKIFARPEISGDAKDPSRDARSAVKAPAGGY